MDRTDLKRASQLSRVVALADRLNNRDSLAEDGAANALMGTGPAFWSTQRYSNARAGIMLYYINRLGGIEGGIAQCRRDYPHTPAEKWSEPASLDWLLPLNSAATTDLVLAYQAAGTFRTRAELIRRTDKAEGADRRVAA